jgi:general secretion pathway protein C
MSSLNRLPRPHAGHHGRAAAVALVTLAIWLGVGLQGAYWAGRLWGAGMPLVSALPPTSEPVIDPVRIARALGVEPSTATATPPVSAAAEGSGAGWRLVGVIADRQGAGAAVLARDGMVARAYRVGATLPDGWRLERVARTEVWLVPTGGGEALRLALPTPPR